MKTAISARAKNPHLQRMSLPASTASSSSSMAAATAVIPSSNTHTSQRKVAREKQLEEERRKRVDAYCAVLTPTNTSCVDMQELKRLVRRSGIPSIFRSLLLGVESPAMDEQERLGHRMRKMEAYKQLTLGEESVTGRPGSSDTPSSASSTTLNAKRKVRPEIQRALQKAKLRQQQKVLGVTATGNYVSRIQRDRDIKMDRQDTAEEDGMIGEDEQVNVMPGGLAEEPALEVVNGIIVKDIVPEMVTPATWVDVLAMSSMENVRASASSTGGRSVASRGGSGSASRRTSVDGSKVYPTTEELQVLLAFDDTLLFNEEIAWMRIHQDDEDTEKLGLMLERVIEAYSTHYTEKKDEEDEFIPQERDHYSGRLLSSSPDAFRMSTAGGNSGMSSVRHPSKRPAKIPMTQSSSGRYGREHRYGSSSNGSGKERPSVGGMVQIILLILRTGMSWEWEVYWCFQRIMDLIDDWFEATPLQVRLAEFLTLFRMHASDLFLHFEEEELDIKDWAAGWLRYLLTRELSSKCSMRLLDAYLAEACVLSSQGQEGTPFDSSLSPDALDLHVYVCVALLLQCKDNLDELEQTEIRSVLHRLPDVDIDEMLACAVRLKHGETVDVAR